MTSSANIFKSVRDNLSLRRGRYTLFERSHVKVDRAEFPAVEAEVPAQVRRRFREQLEREVNEERRNWWKALGIGVPIFIPVLYLLSKAIGIWKF